MKDRSASATAPPPPGGLERASLLPDLLFDQTKMMNISQHSRLDRLETAVWDAIDDLDLPARRRAVPPGQEEEEEEDVGRYDDGNASKAAGIKSGSQGGIGNNILSKTRQLLQPPNRSNDRSDPHEHDHHDLLLPELVTTILQELVTTALPQISQQGSDSEGSSVDLPSTWEELLAWNQRGSSSSSPSSAGAIAFPPWIRGKHSTSTSFVDDDDDASSDPAAASARQQQQQQLEVVLHLLTVLQLRRMSLANMKGGPSNGHAASARSKANSSSDITLDEMIHSLSLQQLELFRSHEARLQADYERRGRARRLRRDLQRQSLAAAVADGWEGDGDGDNTHPGTAGLSLENAPVSSSAPAGGGRHRSLQLVDLMERLSRPHSSTFHISAVAGQQQRGQPRVDLEGADDRRHVGSLAVSASHHASNEAGRGRLDGGEERRKKAAAWSTTSAPSAARTGDGGGFAGGRRSQDVRRGEKPNRGKPNSSRRKSSTSVKGTATVG
jgi:hypothetical protein